jgi:hypothetical protein
VTPRERIIATFNRKPVDRIVLQPRLYYWYYGNGLANRVPPGYTDDTFMKSYYENFPQYDGIVPPELRNKSMIDVYRTLRVSPRYAEEILGVRLFGFDLDAGAAITVTEEKIGHRERVISTKTPKGSMREIISPGQHKEFPVKSPDDFKIMEYVLEHTSVSFDHNAFAIAQSEFGDDGIVTAMIPRSPVQRLIINYMGLENTVMALHYHREETESFMKMIGEWDDRVFSVLGESPIQIVNFGENIDANLISPKIFSKYHVPYYNKRVSALHERGIFCHIHMDGALKPVLPLLKELEFDGIEAPTPLPQGDVTIEELKAALGSMILIDGIPALLFEPHYSLEELRETTIRLLDLFAPNIILGVSDELPPTADISRVRYVDEIIQSMSG